MIAWIFLIGLIVFLIYDSVSDSYYDRDIPRVFAGLAIVIILVSSACNYTTQVGFQEDLITQQRVLKLAETRYNDLLPQLRAELSKYPEYEKNVFASMKGNQVVYIPPQLKANETISQLSDEIKASYDTVCAVKVKIEQSKGSIRYMRRCRGLLLYIP